MYDLKLKSWNELKPSRANLFDGRFCHSCSLYNDRLFIYGGLKNAEITLDNLAILCLDGKVSDIEERIKINESLNYNGKSEEGNNMF